MSVDRSVVPITPEELSDLCRRHHVRRLDLFGSAGSPRFDPHRSDFDFLVEFDRLEPVELAEHYFGLKHHLEDALGRPVDLVETRAIRNPLFREEALRNRIELFAA